MLGQPATNALWRKLLPANGPMFALLGACLMTCEYLDEYVQTQRLGWVFLLYIDNKHLSLDQVRSGHVRMTRK